MAVRLITGRAGSGKTYWCQSRVCQELAKDLNGAPRLIMLVPEQAALQMERGLLTMSPAPTLGRCEVLSFRRLAHRILNEAGGDAPAILSPTGRLLALRHLIARHRKSLREFGRVADRGGVISAIAQAITELFQECVPAEQLEAGAMSALADDDPAGPRLHDLGVLYRAYLEYLGSQRVDPEGVLDLARARLDSAAWISGAQVWIDGFAGLTQQQIRMIVALAGRAAHMDIALLLDPTRGRTHDPDSPPDDLSLFARTERTWFAIVRALHDAGVPVEEPVILGRSGCPRFARAAALARLERELFAAPPEQASRQRPAASEGPAGFSAHNGVRLFKAPDRRAEVAAAVREIVDLVRRPRDPLRYRDISIVVRDLEPHHQLISAALHAHNVPFFIDRRCPTHHHPLIQFVRAALAMHGGGLFDQAVAALLKSGLSGMDDSAADSLENYLLAYGLTSAEVWNEPWTLPLTPRDERRRRRSSREVKPREPEHTDSKSVCSGSLGLGAERGPADAVLVAANAPNSLDPLRRMFRERCGDWWPTPAGKQGRPACRAWIRRLYGLLKRFGAADRLASWSDEAVARGGLDEAAEHEQVWSDLVKLLDEMMETLGGEAMTGRQFRDVLESGLSEFTLGLVPATIDQVLVGSIERSRHPPVRAVFVLGFNDGLFPARPAAGDILGDEERLRLERAGIELSRGGKRQLLDERMLAYVAFTRPSEYLWVSYAESDEAGKPLAPSPLWPYLQGALPGVVVETAETEGPGAISSAGQLAGALALNARAWCESEPLASARAAPEFDKRQSPSTAPPPDPSSAAGDSAWLSLYEWGRSAQPVAGVVQAALKSLAPPEKAALSSAAAAALWPPPYRTSVTRLESFAACPFQHFAAYGLRLEPRPVHEIAAVDMGRLYHLVLEQFVNELLETGSALSAMSPAVISDRLAQLCGSVVPQYAEAIHMQPPAQHAAIRRGRRELPPAVKSQQDGIGKTPLRPLATERIFGDSADDDLPALELPLGDGRTVLVRGIIDRIDCAQAEGASLAVVFDYKRSSSTSLQRLRLDQVFHGLALQLLAYLLVIRDHGQRLAGAKLIPGGAFYLPLLSGLESVQHPSEADQEGFDPFKGYRPRGVLDFDWIDALDPALQQGRSTVFQVYRTKDGGVGYKDRSDAVEAGALPRLLDHVRRKMTGLAKDWLSGDIAVRPAKLGKWTPCSRCLFRSVCRMEYLTREARGLQAMTTSEVLDALGQAGQRESGEAADGPGGSHGNG